jgi:hypothetical protein
MDVQDIIPEMVIYSLKGGEGRSFSLPRGPGMGQLLLFAALLKLIFYCCKL